MSGKAASRPSLVEILGREYAIVYLKPSPLNHRYIGLCDNSAQEIYAEDGQTPIEEKDTVLHETLHGIIHMTRMEIDSETEEMVVSALATGLLSVLQTNPEFSRWLTQKGD